MRSLNEASRRTLAAVSAIGFCLVLALMVGEASRFLTRAYGIRQERELTAQARDERLAIPESARADGRVKPELRVPAVAGRPPAVRRRAPRPASVAAVMSVAFPYRQTVLRVASKHAVDPALVLAIIASESKGDPEAVSASGAIGLMQLMPATALELGVDPWKPEENIEGAVRYLSVLLEQFKSVDLSLVAYNAGPGFAERYRQGEVDLGAETRAFLMRVAGLQ